jgi:serine/threonine protein kinase
VKPLEPDDPRDIAGYRILRVLGAGGMGRVYLGRSPGGRTVAVKVIRPELADDAGFRQLFRREVASARRVAGTWTAPVLDADPEAARPWLVTGYVAGPSVYTAVDRFGPLPEDSVRTLGAGLAEALLTIHGTGLIHRDLKPTNVLLSLDGPRVIDFGISRALDASAHTRTGATVGSPGFMSPEQVDGRDIGPATDVFSLGSVLVFAATGEGPFGAGNGQALMFRIVAKTPELDGVPPGLRNLISACLAKYAGNRPTPQEILDQLAPGGSTEALIAPGWLPGPLTADLGRRAVELLELDSHAPETGSLPPRPTGNPPAASPAGAPGNASAHSGFISPSGAFTPTGSYAPFEAGSSPGASSAPSTPKPRRRTTPWLYLSAFSAAVAIVCTSVLIARADSDPSSGTPKSPTTGTGPTNGPAGPSQAPTPPATPPKSSATPTTTASPTSKPPSSGSTAKAGTIPAGYPGTWTGELTSARGQKSTYTVILRATPDANGIVAHTQAHTVDIIPIDCAGDAKLAPTDAPGLLLQDRPTPPPTLAGGLAVCVTGGQTHVTLNPDGTLTCELLAAGSGNPKGVLRRTGP